ncbi:unnamed protein product [Cyprideis torosa]|uniref:Uncharacterized protein n=1 Tax=Cyprideis torosa TaxID=163714 RepID=A0A7R8W2J1_9CRUS|nr:unnamed protein product [Cyprideis torosa]CAG0882015.1 unnamed protein product [Cyprideis torosa]
MHRISIQWHQIHSFLILKSRVGANRPITDNMPIAVEDYPLKSYNELEQSVDWFRQASPYINAHRNKTFVIALSGDAVAEENFQALIHDIALLHHLGIRLVLVYGIRHQVEKTEAARNLSSKIVNNLRVTDSQTLATVIEVAGSVRVRIESAVSASLPNTPMSGARLSIVSGNFVTARPYGIHDGVDYCHTGIVRRIHANAINKQLQNGNIVLLSPLGYSITGETFNLHAEDVAAKAAEALQAEKLIFLLNEPVVDSSSGKPLRQTTPVAMNALVADKRLKNTPQNILLNSINASLNGIRRVHLIDRKINATHPEYQNNGRAEKLLDYLEHVAMRSGLSKLFVFTTRTKHWFLAQGFNPAALEDLPPQRQSSYNFKRNSSVLIKSLSHSSGKL